jgi:(1->4)-alpha-D-glucan 1-alpha-D-glucosylmutase
MSARRGSRMKPPLRMKSKSRPSSTVAAVAEEILARRRIPVATYRLQFGPNLTFRDAAALVPYLSDLGVTDCYASPLFKTCSKHSHGYDICDHSQLNPELGSERDFEAFVAALQSHDMGLLMDMVSNHMGIGGSENAWWMDVLENGPSSVYAPLFDIDWQPVTPELENRVLLPILEDQYGRVLERGELRLSHEDGAFLIYYGQTRLPVAPRTYDSILGYRLDALAESLGEENEDLQELRSIITAVNYLPLRTELDPEKIAERNREKEVIKRRLAAIYGASAKVRRAINRAVHAFNGTVGDPHSFDMLDALIDAQAYRLAFWRVASDEINYRRFFDVNDLAAVNVEQPEVFESAHELVLKLLAEDKVTGLRIDHSDGLWDPASYFRRLQESYLLQLRPRPDQESDEHDVTSALTAWLEARVDRVGSRAAMPLYVVAEKILSEGEPLPSDWLVFGTTGYDFLNAVNGLFVDGRNRGAFDRIYRHLTGERIDFRSLTNSTKKMIMLVSLASEINDLSHRLERIAKRNRRYRDFTLNTLTFATREVIACLPVYRTYIIGPDTASRRDEGYIEAAVSEAKRRNPRTAAAIFNFIRDTLLLRNVEDFVDEDRDRLVNFVMRFQQMTGPVMAKGVEDTAFYVYNRLVSLNEVGGHPERFGVTVSAFHRENARRRRRWPHSLVATSTHDTKRSEDVRTRINVLSEMPGEWHDAVHRWSRLNARHKTIVDGQAAPDRNDEYSLYQTLVGAWPVEPSTPEESGQFRDRIAAYMLKATKEAKVHTSWVNPHEEYDAAVRSFVLQTLADDGENPFLDDLRPFQRRVACYGHLNSLAQALLKITSPGVPDIYQGTEVWDFSLVDPDNRRPVDFAGRVRLLSELRKQERGGVYPHVQELLDQWQDGRVKLYLTDRALNFRKAHAEMFREGDYLPLGVMGDRTQHVVAYARRKGPAWALVAVPRLVTSLCAPEEPPLGANVWRDTAVMLPQDAPETWRDAFTGETVEVSSSPDTRLLHLRDVFRSFPVALLSGGRT